MAELNLRRVCSRGVVGASVLAVLLAGALAASPALAAASTTVTSPLVQAISTDNLPVATAGTTSKLFQHNTEVETDTFSWGDTVVSAFQVGRADKSIGGAEGIGWATSTDDGTTWSHGILPGLTVNSPSPSAYPLVVNQSVGYDAKAGEWVIPSVTYVETTPGVFQEKALLVNTSSDGITWNTATTAVSTNVDKAWVTCDNTATSPYYGNCYVAYSQINSFDALAVVTSTNGGTTWTAPVLVPSSTPGNPYLGYNTNPVVQPNGHVVIVATDAAKNGGNGSAIVSTASTDGGATFSVPSPITTPIQYHQPAGSNRAKNKPSVSIDAAGKVYAAWADCRFHTSCAADDIVYATSINGTTWSAPIRIALDPTTATDDKFIPGFEVAPGTSGSTAQLAVVYYTYDVGTCSGTACLLDARYATSYNGGATWTSPYQINSTPMPLSWLAATGMGAMVGDYESISFCQGSAITVVSLAASAPTGTSPIVYDQREWALTLPVNWSRPVDATGIAASGSTTIAYGASTTLSATLTDAASGKPINGASVVLQSRPGTSGTFKTVATLTTTSAGKVSRTVSPKVNTQYRWVYAGSAFTKSAVSAIRTVTVTQVVHAQAAPSHAQRSKPVKIFGTVSPHETGRTVVLQERRSGHWATLTSKDRIRSQRLPNGKRTVGFVLSYSTSHSGKRVLRVKRPATATNAMGKSPKLTLLVS